MKNRFSLHYIDGIPQWTIEPGDAVIEVRFGAPPRKPSADEPITGGLTNVIKRFDNFHASSPINTITIIMS